MSSPGPLCEYSGSWAIGDELLMSSVIHPLVLLSVVDHASRVPLPNKKRVLGVLLGQDDGKTINVANS